MKKTISILILILMVFSIVGCAGGQTSDSEYVKIKLDLDGGDINYKTSFEWEKGDVLDLSDRELSKDGYEFVGWFDGEEEIEFPIRVNGDMTLKVKWEKIGEEGSSDSDSNASSDLDSDSDAGPNDSDNASSDSNDTSSDTSTDTGSDYVPPLLDHDMINYTPKYTSDGKKLYYGNYSVKIPTITKYYNNYSAALSMTFDDGADVDAANLASEIMSEYGFKGTLLVNIGNIQGNVARWQELVAKGTLDIGSHGWSHLDPSTITTEQMEHEIKDSYDFLQENFGEYNPVTYATPLSRLTEEYEEYLKMCGFISNRLEIGGTMIAPDNENIDMYSLYAKRIDTGNNVETNVRINVSDALAGGKWFIELYHNVRDNRDGTDVPVEDFRNHCKWLYDNYNGDVWFGSYDDVAKYITQRQTATIEYTACDNESMTFVAKVDKNYGQEMTLKFYMPFFVDSAYAVIDGEMQYLTVEKEPNTRVAYINTEISEEGTEIKIYMGGNYIYSNNCNHNYVENEVLAPTANNFGYTKMICTNCDHTYKCAYTDFAE